MNAPVHLQVNDVAATLRRATPAFLVPVVAGVRAWIKRRNPQERKIARAEMTFVVGTNQSPEVIEHLADAYISRMSWWNQARWHPPLITGQELEGMEHLVAAQSLGRGVLVTCMHHGDYQGIFGSIARKGVRSHIVATPDMFRDDADPFLRQIRKLLETGGNAVVDVTSGSRGIKELLERGCVVGMAIDVAGNTPIRFLGHDLACASGAARVARECGAPIVMATSHRHPEKPSVTGRVRLTPVVDSDQYASAAQLLQAMFDHHAEAVLAWPEAADQPLRITDHNMVAAWKQPGPDVEPDIDPPASV